MDVFARVVLVKGGGGGRPLSLVEGRVVPRLEFHDRIKVESSLVNRWRIRIDWLS